MNNGASLFQNIIIGLCIFMPCFLHAEIKIVDMYVSEPGPYLLGKTYRVYVVTENTGDTDFQGELDIVFTDETTGQSYIYATTEVTVLPSVGRDGIFVDGVFSRRGPLEVSVQSEQPINTQSAQQQTLDVYVDIDSDQDGVLNIQDEDDDNDGLPDQWETDNQTDPLLVDSNSDPDQDGLSNIREYHQQTNPQSADTDNDGLADKWEIDNQTDPLVPDESVDSDQDGLSNKQEQELRTNPQAGDTDGDGLTDKWEHDNHTNPTVADAEQDSDNDGVSNLDEQKNKTNPNSADSDQDSLPDWWEILYNTDPNNSSDLVDRDGDGISNAQEYQNKTNPNITNVSLVPETPTPVINNPKQDTDHDGILDKHESSLGLQVGIPDGLEDLDGDGIPSWKEFEIHTDPHSADSDDDGAQDNWELFYNLDPHDTGDLFLDHDHDRVSSLHEWQTGLNPKNPSTYWIIPDLISYWFLVYWWVGLFILIMSLLVYIKNQSARR